MAAWVFSLEFRLQFAPFSLPLDLRCDQKFVFCANIFQYSLEQMLQYDAAYKAF